MGSLLRLSRCTLLGCWVGATHSYLQTCPGIDSCAFVLPAQVPFDRMTVGQIFFAVVQEQQRPPIPEKGVSAAYLKLMQGCWNTDPKQRPEIPEVLAALKQQYKHHRATNISKSLSSPPESKRC